MKPVLSIIVISQFFCASLWFAGNSIISDIAKELHLEPNFLAHSTSIIQLGFIVGTLIFAIFTISDRVSPSLVFFYSSILAGIFNLAICIPHINSSEILIFRFCTGFFLAGIYPIGMKIASDYYREKLGKSLGLLVGALTLGISFPHLLKNIITGFPWRYVLYSTSTLSIIGGLCILLFVPDGPFRTRSQNLNFGEFMKVFRQENFRSVSFGYFGHMWEVYTFWAFVPVMLSTYNSHYPGLNLNVSLLSFIIIASGALGCVLGGTLSQTFGTKTIAAISLGLSCICCIVSPFFLLNSSVILLITFLIIWGILVVADSPLFSTLVAQTAPAKSRGTALTIVNCIGFAITIVSIQFLNLFSNKIGVQYIYMLLAIGPVFGLVALFKEKKNSTKKRFLNTKQVFAVGRFRTVRAKTNAV